MEIKRTMYRTMYLGTHFDPGPVRIHWCRHNSLGTSTLYLPQISSLKGYTAWAELTDPTQTHVYQSLEWACPLNECHIRGTVSQSTKLSLSQLSPRSFTNAVNKHVHWGVNNHLLEARLRDKGKRESGHRDTSM